MSKIKKKGYSENCNPFKKPYVSLQLLLLKLILFYPCGLGATRFMWVMLGSNQRPAD